MAAKMVLNRVDVTVQLMAASMVVLLVAMSVMMMVAEWAATKDF